MELAHLRGARDLLDREYARPLGVPTMARAALMSPRTSRGASARPLARRRTATCGPASVERAKALRAAGVEVLREPIDQPYGVRDCAVRDPSGNHVRLSQPLAGQA